MLKFSEKEDPDAKALHLRYEVLNKKYSNKKFHKKEIIEYAYRVLLSEDSYIKEMFQECLRFYLQQKPTVKKILDLPKLYCKSGTPE